MPSDIIPQSRLLALITQEMPVSIRDVLKLGEKGLRTSHTARRLVFRLICLSRFMIPAHRNQPREQLIVINSLYI